MDVAAATHDHGANISLGVSLTGIHSFLCFDHELDLTANAGIEMDGFHAVFQQLATLSSLCRNAKNVFRRMRDVQVYSELHSLLFSLLSLYHGVVALLLCLA